VPEVRDWPLIVGTTRCTTHLHLHLHLHRMVGYRVGPRFTMARRWPVAAPGPCTSGWPSE
jgi:hypothetical protein